MIKTLRFAAVACLGVLASCEVAMAQQVVMSASSPTSYHAPMYVVQGTQPYVIDSGSASGGYGLGLSELLLSVRGVGTAPYANAGTGPLYTNLCDYDAPINNATGYHYLCFSPNAQGSGLIAFGYSGSTGPLSLGFSVNGSTPLTLSAAGATLTTPTLSGATLTTPTITGGSISGASITATGASLTSPTITGGSISTASITGGTISGASITATGANLTSPTITTPTITGGTLSAPAITGGTITGVTISGLTQAVRVVTAAGAITLTSADSLVVVNKTVGAATTVNLPGSPVTGQSFTIKDGKGDAQTNNITITNGTIDGAASVMLRSNYASVTIIYNGAAWNAL